MTLYCDDDGDVWSCTGAACTRLGPATEARYHDVPCELWAELAELIDEAADAERCRRGCREAAEAAYYGRLES